MDLLVVLGRSNLYHTYGETDGVKTERLKRLYYARVILPEWMMHGMEEFRGDSKKRSQTVDRTMAGQN